MNTIPSHKRHLDVHTVLNAHVNIIEFKHQNVLGIVISHSHLKNLRTVISKIIQPCV